MTPAERTAQPAIDSPRNLVPFWTRCPECRALAEFPVYIDGQHRCSACGRPFLPIEVLGWMQP